METITIERMDEVPEWVAGLLNRALDNTEAQLKKLQKGFEADSHLFDDGTLGEFEIRMMAVETAAIELLESFQNILIERNGVKF